MNDNDHALLEFEAMSRLIEPDGVTCVMALAIKSPLSLDELADIIKREVRKVRSILERCAKYGYVGLVAPLNATRWAITDKGRAVIGLFFQHLLGAGSDPVQLSLSGSDPALLTGESDSPVVTRGAQPQIIHSDQIIDQSRNSESDLGMNETPQTPRDLQAVAAALDDAHIRDLPGKPNRSDLLADPWMTPERISAAVERARHNPRRKSPNPLGLAVTELRAHHAGIDEWIAAHSPAEPLEAEPEEPTSAEDEMPIKWADNPIAIIWEQAKDELALEMTKLSFETFVKPTQFVDYSEGVFTLATETEYAREFLERARSSIERILSGIVDKPQQVEFVVRQNR